MAGRTDAGVHATGQVAHVDLASQLDRHRLLRALNGLLPADVRVYQIRPAPPTFDARFSALSRRYSYRVAEGVVEPLRRHDTAAHRCRLDIAEINRAGRGLLGEHDFAAYCRSRPGATTLRRLLTLQAHRYAGVVVFAVEADAFCHGMVRSLVGALLAVGDGRRPVSWPAALLAAGRREGLLGVAPARGLTLTSVRYPPAGELASRAAITRNLRLPADAL